MHVIAKHYLYIPFSKQVSTNTLSSFLECTGRRLKQAEPDGNCLFRALSDQLFDNQGEHFTLRSMFIWLESLNRPVFTNYLLTVNEPDIDQHIKKMALPNVWGTHVEIIAAATFYQIPVYFTTKENNEHRWEVIKPIPAERIRMPRVMDCLPDSHNNLTHFELAYHVHTRSH